MTTNQLLMTSINLRKMLEKTLSSHGLDFAIELSPVSDDAIPLARIDIELNRKLTIALLLNTCFPSSPPVVLVQEKDRVDSIHVSWDTSLPIENRIRTMINTILYTSTREIVYGTLNGLPLTDNPDIAKTAEWHPLQSEKDLHETRQEIIEGIYARTLGVLSKDILEKKVLLIGIGSVGSYVADQLIRSGVGRVTIMDPDLVEYSNLSRTVYTLSDVYQPKVKAIKRHLLNINPSIDIEDYEEDITDFSNNELLSIFKDSDVVVAATDDPKAQRIINRFAYGTGKPAIFTGLYKGADGGEVIISVPEQTPCYQCSTSIRHQIEETSGEVSVRTDYGTGKLLGEVALAADIHHVASTAVKMVLSLLLPNESEVKLNGFAKTAIEQDLTYLTLSMKDQYWFYPHIFKNIAGQYAYQSVWLTPSRIDECPVCGDQDYRSSLSIPLKSPSISSIRKARE